MDLRRGRFTISEAGLNEMLENLPSDDIWDATEGFSRFSIGFLYLWHGDLDLAEKHLQHSLAEAEHVGDVTTLVRALAYLTVVRRKRQQVEEVKQYAERMLKTALLGQMVEYISSSYGHQAWVALREGRVQDAYPLAEEGVRLMQKTPMGAVILWIPLWPLITAETLMGQTAEAIERIHACFSAPRSSRCPIPSGPNLSRLSKSGKEVMRTQHMNIWHRPASLLVTMAMYNNCPDSTFSSKHSETRDKGNDHGLTARKSRSPE